MKKNLLFILATIVNTTVFSQIYMAKNCETSFFSSSPIENIEAINKTSKPLLNTATGDFQVKIVMAAFVFEKPLMQEHFNENYMESEKFPNAIFKGRINEKIDWTKDGEHQVTVTGSFLIHGVSKERTINGTVTIKGSQIIVFSKFNIHVADYDIKVPSLYVANIAEDVEVKINATLEPFKKN